MNLLFFVIFLLSTLLLLCTAPDNFVGALLSGAGKGAATCVSLVASYALWMGLMQIWQDSGVTRGVSKLVKPLAKRLFRTDDEAALAAVSMNLSVNLLGIAGASTAYGIKAAKLLDKTENAEYASAMLFVLNAASLQLLPTSAIAARFAMQSVNPYDILPPCFLASLFSVALSVALTKLFFAPHRAPVSERIGKRREAGI